MKKTRNEEENIFYCDTQVYKNKIAAKRIRIEVDKVLKGLFHEFYFFNVHFYVVLVVGILYAGEGGLRRNCIKNEIERFYDKFIIKY